MQNLFDSMRKTAGSHAIVLVLVPFVKEGIASPGSILYNYDRDARSRVSRPAAVALVGGKPSRGPQSMEN